MTFLKFCVGLIAFVCTTTLHAQAKIDPAIQAKINAFIAYSNSKEWDKAFDLLYPKLFEKVPKQDLVDVMTSMEADGLSLSMSDTRITSASEPRKEGGETFVKVEYTSNVTVHIKTNGLYDSPKAIQALEEQFKTTYGASKVKWNESRKEFMIIAEKSMMAIDGGNKDWKLVEINLDQMALMEYLFPSSIMDAFVLTN